MNKQIFLISKVKLLDMSPISLYVNFPCAVFVGEVSSLQITSVSCTFDHNWLTN